MQINIFLILFMMNSILKFKYKIGYFTSLFILLFAFSGHAQERLISLKPNVTEILDSLGLTDQLVGVTTYCDYPSSILKLPKVADYVHADVEKVLSLKPTMVLGSQENSLKKEVDFLEKQGIQVYLFKFDRLEAIFESIQKISVLFKKENEAKEVVQKMRSQLQTIANSIPSVQKPKVLMVVGRRPMVVVGGNNLLDDLLHLLKVSNVAGGSKIRYPTYSTERLISSQPDIIIDISMGTEKGNREDILKWYQQFSSIPAVKNKRIHFLDISLLRPSPRMIIGTEELKAVLWPEPL